MFIFKLCILHNRGSLRRAIKFKLSNAPKPQPSTRFCNRRVVIVIIKLKIIEAEQSLPVCAACSAPWRFYCVCSTFCWRALYLKTIWCLIISTTGVLLLRTNLILYVALFLPFSMCFDVTSGRSSKVRVSTAWPNHGHSIIYSTQTPSTDSLYK
jgi:hypothetical protein